MTQEEEFKERRRYDGLRALVRESSLTSVLSALSLVCEDEADESHSDGEDAAADTWAEAGERLAGEVKWAITKNI